MTTALASGAPIRAADRVTVKIGCRADGRVAETLGDGCEVHAFFEQEARVAVSGFGWF